MYVRDGCLWEGWVRDAVEGREEKGGGRVTDFE